MELNDAFITELEERMAESDSEVVARKNDRLELRLLIAIYRKLERYDRNPMIRLGEFIQGNPRLALSFMILALIIINMWFISDLRHPTLKLFGFDIGP